MDARVTTRHHGPPRRWADVSEPTHPGVYQRAETWALIRDEWARINEGR